MEDLRWQAWQYLLGEMDDETEASFENRLSEDSGLQHQLASVAAEHERLLALELNDGRVARVEPASSKMSVAPFVLAATAACLLLLASVYAVSNLGNRSNEMASPETNGSEEIAGLVTAWSQASNPSESESDPFAYQLATSDDEAWFADSLSDLEDQDTAMEESISWRVIALDGLDEASSMN